MMQPIDDITPDPLPPPHQPTLQPPPSWAVGVWFWAGGDRVVSINSNGVVSVIVNGQTYIGVYDGSNNTIFLNGDTSDVSATVSGIRTYNRTSGQSSDYTHSSTQLPTQQPPPPEPNNPMNDTQAQPECFWGTAYLDANGNWQCPAGTPTTLPPVTVQQDTGTATNQNNTVNTPVSQAVASVQTFVQTNPTLALVAVGVIAYLLLKK